MKIPREKCDKCGGTGRVASQDGLGDKMRMMRQNANISLRGVARRLGQSATYIGDLETGKGYWSRETLRKYIGVIREIKREREEAA